MTIAVIADISPDSGYPNLCTRLGTAHHPKHFRHSRLDRWIGERQTEREGEEGGSGGRGRMGEGESVQMHYQREMDGRKVEGEKL